MVQGLKRCKYALNPDFCYRNQETGALHYGDELMNLGLITSDGQSGQMDGAGEGYGDFMSRLYVLKRDTSR